MAAAGEPHGGQMGFLGLLSFRRNQVVSMESTQEEELQELEQFQSHVANRFLFLLPHEDSSPLLSLSFLSKLLDALLLTEQEFRSLLPILLSRNPAILSRPPTDRLVSDLLDRAVKSLDLCNAVSLSLHALRHSHRQALIAANSLLQSPHLGDAQLSRARRALSKLFSMSIGQPLGRTGSSGSGSSGRDRDSSSNLHNRSLSFAVSRNWSAKQQVQAMSAHLAAPRAVAMAEAGGAGGLALAVYTMSSVLVFSMWVLVSAVPCQDRTAGGAATAPPPPPPLPPKHLYWAPAVLTLQERVTDEWRKKEKSKSGSGGALLAEMQAAEKSARFLMEWVEEGAEEGGPLIEEERAAEVAARAAELEEACRSLEAGLGPFERQVRAVFHRVVSSRAEVIRCLDHSTRSAATCPSGTHHAGVPPLPNSL